MNFFKRSAFVAVLAVFLMGGFYYVSLHVYDRVRGDRMIPPQLRLDGIIYSRSQLKKAFLDIALNEPGLSSEEESKHYDRKSGRSILLEPVNFKRQYPWLYEYIYRELGQPRHPAINKYVGNVLISFGFPNDLKPYDLTEESKAGRKYMFERKYFLYEATSIPIKKDSATVLAGAEMRRIVRLLNDKVDFELSLTSDEKEAASTPAMIRIIIDIRKYVRGGYKRSGSYYISTGGSRALFFRSDIERKYIKHLVYFAPAIPQGVDGYLLPKSNNVIGMSFCFVDPDTEQNVFKGHIRECIMGSLGLSGVTSLKTKGALSGEFIKQEDGILSEFDLYMLNILYSPAVKVGMTRQELEAIL